MKVEEAAVATVWMEEEEEEEEESTAQVTATVVAVLEAVLEVALAGELVIGPPLALEALVSK